jgi:uncharacterized membrane protein YphA (DoxX/SURF4 family)
MSRSKQIFIWILRLIGVFLMVQSLFFKFSGAPESVYIFSTLGMEPWGRIGTGVVELVASILILMPGTTWLGALIGVGTMCGAIFSHLAKLGIEVGGDGGQLFLYAVITLVCCAILVVMEWSKISNLYRLLISK